MNQQIEGGLKGCAMPRSGVRVGLGLVLALIVMAPAVTQADPLGEAQDQFLRASAAAELALQRALSQVPPEAGSAIQHALDQLHASRERTLRELGGAGEAGEGTSNGRARALEAVDRGTQTHLDVLQDVLQRVPSQAQSAIQRALEVSRNGRETALAALQREGGRGSGVPPGPPAEDPGGPPPSVPPGPPADVLGRIPGERIGPPGGIPSGHPLQGLPRGLGEVRPPVTVPAGPPAGVLGGSAGIGASPTGGPPVGSPGGRPAGPPGGRPAR